MYVLTKSIPYVWKDSSVIKKKKSSMSKHDGVCTCNPSDGEVETGRLLGLAAYWANPR